MKKHLYFFVLFITLSILTGCTSPSNIKTTESPKVDSTTSATIETEDTAVYHKINATEAKSMMDESISYILLDVRTQAEYDEGHIEGAILLPYDQIKNEIGKYVTDKTQMVLIYCRSGNRSATAAKAIVAMGYSNVYDFGGIIDWPYETVK